jgi:hypothetical protein
MLNLVLEVRILVRRRLRKKIKRIWLIKMKIMTAMGKLEILKRKKEMMIRN